MVRVKPVAGRHYPETFVEFGSWFATDADCLDYLEWLRWPDGFVCVRCGGRRSHRLGDGRLECAECAQRTSVTAGTIFDRTRTPLTVWFNAAWLFATPKDGTSALALRRNLSLGSYQTAWTMLHRFRSVAVRPGRDLLGGRVEVDETFVGGRREGHLGGRTPGEKALVAVAVEVLDPKGFGRCRMVVIEDGSAQTLRRFLTGHVQAGSTVVTDGWQPYRRATKDIYIHERHVAPGRLAHELLPGVHRVASLLKRWLLSTHQGSAGDEHLQAYLDEFVFRFNRRTARNRGLLFYRLLEGAVDHGPVRYRQLIKTPRPNKVAPTPPVTRGKPRSLEVVPVGRPWRSL